MITGRQVSHMGVLPRRVSISDVMVAISRRFGVTPDLLRGPRQTRTVAQPRQIAYFMVSELRPDLSITKIARQFGDRDHTTIINGIGRAREMMSADRRLRTWVNRTVRELRNA